MEPYFAKSYPQSEMPAVAAAWSKRLSGVMGWFRRLWGCAFLLIASSTEICCEVRNSRIRLETNRDPVIVFIRYFLDGDNFN